MAFLSKIKNVLEAQIFLNNKQYEQSLLCSINNLNKHGYDWRAINLIIKTFRSLGDKQLLFKIHLANIKYVTFNEVPWETLVSSYLAFLKDLANDSEQSDVISMTVLLLDAYYAIRDDDLFLLNALENINNVQKTHVIKTESFFQLFSKERIYNNLVSKLVSTKIVTCREDSQVERSTTLQSEAITRKEQATELAVKITDFLNEKGINSDFICLSGLNIFYFLGKLSARRADKAEFANKVWEDFNVILEYRFDFHVPASKTKEAECAKMLSMFTRQEKKVSRGLFHFGMVLVNAGLEE